jgi:hypothetical protein
MKQLDCLSLYDGAAFYDIEFAARQREIPFFLKYVAQAGGAVLEEACGTATSHARAFSVNL